MEFTNDIKIYSNQQEIAISDEFKRIEGMYYLDHAGATLYSEKQIKSTYDDLINHVYANPHARNTSAKITEDTIDIARYEILDNFNTTSEEYSIIFTSGATGALKLVAENFNYQNGCFTYLEDNHTSVLGMRNLAPQSVEIKIEDAYEVMANKHVDIKTARTHVVSKEDGHNLFVYPAQSNFNGTKYPLEWIDHIKENVLNNLQKVELSKNWHVFLDCASFVSTNHLDLTKYQPDFACISFYKMFGYPTGLGALLVKKSSQDVLLKKYFGGGTVFMALAAENTMIPKINFHERFEDGTIPFLSILAVKHGFDTLKRLNLNFDLISKHTFSLGQFVYNSLKMLHHSNGQPAIILYHDTVYNLSDHQGGIINFNVLRSNGDYVGYSEVLQMADLHGIQLRTGCFCNPGACQKHLNLTIEDVKKHFDAGHVCGDQHDLIDGIPTGSIRISFGYMSKLSEAKYFLNMIRNCFILHTTYKTQINKNYICNTVFSGQTNKNGIKSESNENLLVPQRGILEHIFLYPIKSCGAFSVQDSWILTSTGLKYDREWMIVNSAKVVVTQKQNKRLCLIKPTLNLIHETLKLEYPDCKSIEIEINYTEGNKSIAPCKSKICGDQIQGWDCGDKVAQWLSNALDSPGLRLLRQFSDTENSIRTSKKNFKSQLSFVNKAQYLLLNTASVQWLIEKIPKAEMFEESLMCTMSRFRPNFIVSFPKPFTENEFDEFYFHENHIVFKSGGKCTRCQIICINQYTSEATKEPLATLSREFKGQICFGLYLNQEHQYNDKIIKLGSKILGKRQD